MLSQYTWVHSIPMQPYYFQEKTRPSRKFIICRTTNIRFRNSRTCQTRALEGNAAGRTWASTSVGVSPRASSFATIMPAPFRLSLYWYDPSILQNFMSGLKEYMFIFWAYTKFSLLITAQSCQIFLYCWIITSCAKVLYSTCCMLCSVETAYNWTKEQNK